LPDLDKFSQICIRVMAMSSGIFSSPTILPFYDAIIKFLIINIIDYYIGIPVDRYGIVMIHSVIIGILLFIILYFYVKHNKKVIG